MEVIPKCTSGFLEQARPRHYCPADFKKGCLMMWCGVQIVNTLTSAAACTATRGKSTTAFPFQRPLGRGEWGGCETGPFPSFSRRGGCAINKKIPFLSGADGVVGKFQQNKVRFADIYADIYKEATRPFENHPVCAAEEWDLLINGAATSLEKEGE